MTLNPKELKLQARQALEAQQKAPGRLPLIHAGISVGASILLLILELALLPVMDQASGLSGMGLRSILSTVPAFLNFIISALTPLWSIGLVAVALAYGRRQQAQPSHLLEGFRRFRPVLRLLVLKIIILLGVSIGVGWVSTFLSGFLPVNPEFETFITANYDAFLQDPEAVLAAMPTGLLAQAALPTLVLTAALLIAATIPLFYRLRLADYAIMDVPGTRARQALAFSFRAMKGNCIPFFKLDLSLWWYYALQVGLSAVLYLDILLPALGVALPFSSHMANLLCYTLYGAGLLALSRFVTPQVITTYAAAYVAIKDKQ